MELRRFTDRGTHDFTQFLEALSQDPRCRVPVEMLSDPGRSEALPYRIELRQAAFASRLDAARELDRVLSSAPDAGLHKDAALWAWLTLFHFDSVCPPTASGERGIGTLARYIADVDNYRRYYRHLLAGPFLVYRAHRDNPDRAMVLLCGPVHKPGEDRKSTRLNSSH